MAKFSGCLVTCQVSSKLITRYIFKPCTLVRVREQFNYGRVHYLFILVACTFSLFNNVLVLLCVIFLTYMCCPRLCSHGGWLLLKCSAIGIGFNGAETNCGIAHILGILLMNSWDTQLYFYSNYYNLESVYFELSGHLSQ